MLRRVLHLDVSCKRRSLLSDIDIWNTREEELSSLHASQLQASSRLSWPQPVILTTGVMYDKKKTIAQASFFYFQKQKMKYVRISILMC